MPETQRGVSLLRPFSEKMMNVNFHDQGYWLRLCLGLQSRWRLVLDNLRARSIVRS